VGLATARACPVIEAQVAAQLDGQCPGATFVLGLPVVHESSADARTA
jgi:hypothetical protein